MKNIYVMIAIAISNQVIGQNNFQKIGPPPPAIQILDEIEGLYVSSNSSADVDNDGDIDLLFTGQNTPGAMKANLYINNGLGGYTLNTTVPFNGVYDGSSAFFDADNDGDQDVIITGQDFTGYSANLYLNDGNGNFTTATVPFIGVGYSSVSIADVDNDLDADVLICGQSNFGTLSSLYLNDGVGNFTFNASASSLFSGIYMGSSKFGDLDSDGDKDLILIGYGNSGSISEMYLNNGSGVFTAIPSILPPLNSSDIALSDLNDDSYLDIVITGSDPSLGATTKLYFNNGFAAFTLDNSNSLTQMFSSSLAINDVDNDGDNDIAIAGSTPANGYQTKLYLNDGNGILTVVTGLPFTGIGNGDILFDDIDGDNDGDLVITGAGISAIYQNIGNGNFEALSTTPFMGLNYGAVALADVDNDGDLDAFMNGQGTAGVHSKLYLNDGNGGYTIDQTNNFLGLANAAADFADIDNDGDVDLITAGYNNGQYTKLYINDGNGLFSETTTTFPSTSSGALKFHDVDNDGDQDVFISGSNFAFGNINQLWINDGTGNFTFSSANTFEGANNGNIALADIDGDNDADVLMTGYGNFGRIAKLYTNDGSGIFTLISSPFPGVQQGSIDFSDVDNDQDMDLVIAGEASSSSNIAELYLNDGTGNFTLVPSTPFEPTIASGLIFADIDNDLDEDLLTIGYNNSTFSSISKLYSNDGAGNFALISGTPFNGASYGMATFGDIDGDMDLDVIICGNDGITGIQSNVYRNNNCQQANNFHEVLTCGPYTWIDGITYTQSTNNATWLYATPNSAGCDSVAVLHLTIGDATATPTIANLPTITAECEVNSINPPTALFNCSGMITGVTNQTFPISNQDTTNVLWTFTSANGFEITQTQMVIIHDVTAPVTTGTLPAITTSCVLYSVNTVPTAMDNCEGIIEGSTNDLPVLTIGSTFITWNFVDSDGNTSTQLQEVIFTPINDTITFDGTTLTVGESNATYQWYDCSTENVIVGETNQTFTPTSDGIYAVLVDNGECNALSDCFTITNLSVDEMQTTQFTLFPNPSNGMITIQSQAPLTLVITTTTGQTVYEGVINSGNTSIDLSGYAAGVYYATSNSSNGLQQTRKITLTK